MSRLCYDSFNYSEPCEFLAGCQSFMNVHPDENSYGEKNYHEQKKSLVEAVLRMRVLNSYKEND